LVSSRRRDGHGHGSVSVAVGTVDSVSARALLDVEETHRADTLATRSMATKHSIRRNPEICILNTGEWLALKRNTIPGTVKWEQNAKIDEVTQ
jgi:hypothetical protein